MKVVINSDYGGFSLSDKAVERLFALKKWKLVKQDRDSGFTLYYKDYIGEDSLFDERDLERDDPDLVRVVDELGEDADGRFASLSIVDIPDDVKWHISEVDGLEHVAEDHRTWY